MAESIIETWRKIILGAEKSWALFESGTVVILMQPETDLSLQAIRIMQESGEVVIGTPAGDFSVIKLEEDPGWVVAYDHPDILNYVSQEEAGEDANDWKIGLRGRSKRDEDATDLNVIYVEDKR